MSHDSRQTSRAGPEESVTSPAAPGRGNWFDGQTHATGATASHRGDDLRILVHNWRDIDHPDAGGAEVFTHEVLKRLVDRGHDVTLFTAGFDGGDPEAHVDGVRIVRAGGRFSVYGRAMTHYRGVRGEFDVVVDEINGPPFLTPAYVEEPVVALIHHVLGEGWYTELPRPIGGLGHFLQDWWLRPYRSVPTVTVSTSTMRDLESRGFTDVRIAPEGIDVEPLETVPDTPDRPTFVYVGRMSRAKRPSHAIEAFEYLRERYPTARLHMVGDGYLLDELRARAGEGVVFHGYVSEERKLDLLRRSHALLITSVREGWGLVVTEANAMGTPAVGYNVKGIRDSIRNGENGLLATEDPMRLAQRALSVLESDYDRYVRNALGLARGHDWETTADTFERTLREVAE